MKGFRISLIEPFRVNLLIGTQLLCVAGRSKRTELEGLLCAVTWVKRPGAGKRVKVKNSGIRVVEDIENREAR